MAIPTHDEIKRMLAETGLRVLPEMQEYEVPGMVQNFLDGNGAFFGCCAYQCHGQLDLVRMNERALRERGIYEAALVSAYTGCKVNNLRWRVGVLERIFRDADRDKLRAAGDPLPGDGPFVVYRGVSGEGRERRVRGLSWTGSLDVACWFALRFGSLSSAPDPAVYQAEVKAEEVFCYCAENRSESEFIVRPRRPVRLPLEPVEIEARRKAHCERIGK